MQSTNPTHTFPGLEISLAPPKLYYRAPPDSESSTTASSHTEVNKHHRTAGGWYVPVLSVNITDVTSAGARRFLASVDAAKLLEDAVVCVAKRLYGCPELQPVT